MAFDLIIFDCDGTLVDSEELNIKAIIELITQWGASGYDLEYGLNNFSGLRFSTIIGTIAKEQNIEFPEKAAALYLERVRILSQSELTPIAGVERVVDAASKMAKICVVSNGERKNVISSIAFAELSSYFPDENVISGLMAPNPKPAPDLFLLASDQHQVSPPECLVIEDSITGVRAAKAAGMECWGFYGTHHAPKKHATALSDAGADHVFLSMEEILERLYKVQRA